MEPKTSRSRPAEPHIELQIGGSWTAGDFSRVFELLHEANALVSAVLLDRLAVRHKGAETLYLRRALHAGDPKVIIEAVQFGSPGSILARLPGAAREVWELLRDILWGHKAARKQAELGVELKREELAQARLRTEAMTLELQKLREEIKQARFDAAGAALELCRREEEVAASLLASRLGTAVSLLEAVRGFHERTGIPYALIERYLTPRLDALSQSIGYLVGGGLLEGMEARLDAGPPAGQDPPGG